ncbi:uncharacterized protein BDR25DRAFT_15969 [Lindgomyces ingoldianus]|uniref:Uncharacterized protein n=1 Tax=Lindgomyces ingoldianus TaxID=673940 RepID=A0ACB6R054_9PLEO|nr:uncharacterized protein BDR25DRAFT_15969 [Lindgomyces ingoldianus]KAF2472619.1 hypothetical protein BDR25DRAFT_15969 [Lindgomyces ingoldianus]
MATAVDPTREIDLGHFRYRDGNVYCACNPGVMQGRNQDGLYWQCQQSGVLISETEATRIITSSCDHNKVQDSENVIVGSNISTVNVLISYLTLPRAADSHIDNHINFVVMHPQRTAPLNQQFNSAWPVDPRHAQWEWEREQLSHQTERIPWQRIFGTAWQLDINQAPVNISPEHIWGDSEVVHIPVNIPFQHMWGNSEAVHIQRERLFLRLWTIFCAYMSQREFLG